MRESNYGGGWKTERYSDSSRSRFDDRMNSKQDYGSDNRSFNTSSRSSGSYAGSSGNYVASSSGSFNKRDEGTRYGSGSRRYDDESPKYGSKGSSQYTSSSTGPSNYSNSGPSNYGNSGSSNYGNNVPSNNYGTDGRSNYGNSGPNFGSSGPNYGNSGPNFGNSGPNFGNSGPNYGNSGPPNSRSKDMGPPGGSVGSMANQNYGNSPNDSDFMSSIQSISQMNAQNEIATKIISAVLTTGLMAAQGASFSDGQMGGFSDRNPYPPPRSSRGGGPPPRRSGPAPPSRFSRERLRSERLSYPSRGSRSGFDNSLSSRSSLSRKRSMSSSSPRDSSKSKRRRSLSKEREKSPGKRNEDKDSLNKKESKSKDKDGSSEDKKDDIPLAALYCHMCKHGNFASVKTYLYHLDGIKHRKTAMAFHARNEATLEYLRKNAKLANVRFGGKDVSVPASKCTVCTAIIKEPFSKHKRLLEHKIVKKFMNPTCCSRYFKNRYDMNEHRLSLPHLKKMYEVTEEQKIFLDDVKAKPGKWNHDDIVKQLIARNPEPETHLTLDNIPPFDGNTFIGVKFLRAKDATLCKPCKLLIPVGIKSLETHMVSIEHYDNVMDYLREKKKRRAEAGDKKKGEGEEGFSDSDSDDENVEGNASGARYSRRNHERDDDDDEDDDEEETVQAMKGSDDEEEEKDDMPFYDEASHIVLEEIGEDLPKKDEEQEKDHEGHSEIKKEKEKSVKCETKEVARAGKTEAQDDDDDDGEEDEDEDEDEEDGGEDDGEEAVEGEDEEGEDEEGEEDEGEEVEGEEVEGEEVEGEEVEGEEVEGEEAEGEDDEGEEDDGEEDGQ